MKTSLRNFLITLAVALIIFGVAAYFIATFVTMTLADSIEGTPAVSLEIITADSDNTQQSKPDNDNEKLLGESFTFAVIGTDYQPDVLIDYDVENEFADRFPSKRNRTYSADSIAIVRADKESKSFLITTVPSNMRLEVDGLVTTLGNVYYEKGLDFFLGKLTALTGFEISKYFVIDINNFAPIIDEIGGVTFNVPENMSYSDSEQKLDIDLKKGSQKIDGKKASELLRFNNYIDSTNSRAKTTAEFMSAVAEKISDASFIQKATSILATVSKHTTTNYTAEDLSANLLLLSDFNKLEKIVTVYPGKYITVDGEAKFEPDIKKAISEYSKYR